MNRIYQGRVAQVEIPKLGDNENPWQLLPNGQDILCQHHQLFQDAVNYYIVALAALGSSPDSKLTRLRELLKPVWEGFDKKGQRRQGMRDSLQRAWQLDKAPSLPACARPWPVASGEVQRCQPFGKRVDHVSKKPKDALRNRTQNSKSPKTRL